MPKRKRNEKAPEAQHDDEDAQHSVLGGMKGGYRLTGNDTPGKGNESVKQFKVPFNDRSVICEKRGGAGAPLLIFTHGAGGGLANPAMKEFAEGFAQTRTVVTFQGTMNLKSRVQTFHSVIEHQGVDGALGGRSMGARAAAIAAAEPGRSTHAVVLVSFPLVGGKKGDSREQVLLDLPEQMKVLFVVGSKDAQCDLKHLRKVMEKMSAQSWLVEVQGADHSMSWKHKGSVQTMRRKTGSIAADWLTEHDEERRYCLVRLDEESGDVACHGWRDGPALID